MNEKELIKHIRETANPQVAWARSRKLDPSVVSLVVNGKRHAPDSLLKALGLKRIVTFEPIRSPK